MVTVNKHQSSVHRSRQVSPAQIHIYFQPMASHVSSHVLQDVGVGAVAPPCVSLAGYVHFRSGSAPFIRQTSGAVLRGFITSINSVN